MRQRVLPATSLGLSQAPTWLFFPFWMHSIFFSAGAAHEIWEQGGGMSAMSQALTEQVTMHGPHSLGSYFS